MKVLKDNFLRKYGDYKSYYVYVFKATKEPCYEVGDRLLSLINQDVVELDTERFSWIKSNDYIYMKLDIIKFDMGFVHVVNLNDLNFYILTIAEFFKLYKNSKINNGVIEATFAFDSDSEFNDTIILVGDSND